MPLNIWKQPLFTLRRFLTRLDHPPSSKKFMHSPLVVNLLHAVFDLTSMQQPFLSTQNPFTSPLHSFQIPHSFILPVYILYNFTHLQNLCFQCFPLHLHCSISFNFIAIILFFPLVLSYFHVCSTSTCWRFPCKTTLARSTLPQLLMMQKTNSLAYLQNICASFPLNHLP